VDDGGDRAKASVLIGSMGLSLQVGMVAGGIRALRVDPSEPQNLGAQD